MIYTKKLRPPTAYDHEDAIVSYKLFIQDIIELFESAGFVLSSEVGNYTPDTIPDIPWPTSTSWMDGALSFDLTDSLQAEYPIRISMSFGLYRYSNSPSYPPRILVYTSVGKISNTSNEIETSLKTYSNSSIYSYSSSFSYGPYYHDYGLSSFISVKDGFVCVCICPGYGDYSNSTDYTLPRGTLSFITIERNMNDDYTYNGTGCNVLSRRDSATSGTGSLTCSIINSSMITTTNNLVYIPSTTYLSNGNIVIFPVYHVNNNDFLIQSPNIFSTHAKSVGDSQFVNMIIDGVERQFFSVYSGPGTYISNSDSALLIAVD